MQKLRNKSPFFGCYTEEDGFELKYPVVKKAPMYYRRYLYSDVRVGIVQTAYIYNQYSIEEGVEKEHTFVRWIEDWERI